MQISFSDRTDAFDVSIPANVNEIAYEGESQWFRSFKQPLSGPSYILI